jgi:hypothetical protein
VGSHIIAKHGAEVLDDVVETIAKGIPIWEQGAGITKRVVLQYRQHEAVLSLYKSGDRHTWLLSGFKTGQTDINFDLSQLRGPIFFKPN